MPCSTGDKKRGEDRKEVCDPAWLNVAEWSLTRPAEFDAQKEYCLETRNGCEVFIPDFKARQIYKEAIESFPGMMKWLAITVDFASPAALLHSYLCTSPCP